MLYSVLKSTGQKKITTLQHKDKVRTKEQLKREKREKRKKREKKKKKEKRANEIPRSLVLSFLSVLSAATLILNLLNQTKAAARDLTPFSSSFHYI